MSSTTEDLKHIVELCNSDLIATVPEFQECSQAVSKLTCTKVFTCDLPPSPPPGSQTFVLEPKGQEISLEKGCLLIFSSGTTARPKGVLHTRRSAVIGLKAQIQNFNLTKSDTWLHHMPVNWGTGITILIMCIATGACLELCAPYFDTEWLLERLQEGGITCLFLRASTLEPIAERVAQLEDIWPTSKYDALLNGIRQLRVVCSGALRVSPASQTIWKNLRDGRPLMVVYAMSESLTLVATTDWQYDENLSLVSVLMCI
jgi:acyl-CoA synthetase (AMP-forming)/AMP-acid ligase II